MTGPREIEAVAPADADRVIASLFVTEARPLLGMLTAYTGDAALAEEIVQESFVRLHRSWHRVRDDAAGVSYLRSIAFNLARSHFRRLKVVRRTSSDRGVAMPSAEAGALLDEDRREVAAALRRLSPRQRECLVLRFWAGLSESEIASTIGVSSNSVKTHVRRGLATLETLLGGSR